MMGTVPFEKCRNLGGCVLAFLEGEEFRFGVLLEGRDRV